MIGQKIGSVLERVIDRCLIADKGDARIFQRRDPIVEQSFEAKFNLMSAVRHLSN
jgi:hypothetical protein